MSAGLEVILIAVCMVGAAFFAGIETGVISIHRMRLRHFVREGMPGAHILQSFLENTDRLLGTTLVGTNISTVILVTLGTMLMIQYFGEIGDLYAVLLFTPLFLILGEIVPKSVYQQKSDEIAPVIVYPLRFFSGLSGPWARGKIFPLIGSARATLGPLRFSGSQLRLPRFIFGTLCSFCSSSCWAPEHGCLTRSLTENAGSSLP